jgi:hypothetical protein
MPPPPIAFTSEVAAATPVFPDPGELVGSALLVGLPLETPSTAPEVARPDFGVTPGGNGRSATGLGTPPSDGLSTGFESPASAGVVMPIFGLPLIGEGFGKPATGFGLILGVSTTAFGTAITGFGRTATGCGFGTSTTGLGTFTAGFGTFTVTAERGTLIVGRGTLIVGRGTLMVGFGTLTVTVGRWISMAAAGASAPTAMMTAPMNLDAEPLFIGTLRSKNVRPLAAPTNWTSDYQIIDSPSRPGPYSLKLSHSRPDASSPLWVSRRRMAAKIKDLPLLLGGTADCQ